MIFVFLLRGSEETEGSRSKCAARARATAFFVVQTVLMEAGADVN